MTLTSTKTKAERSKPQEISCGSVIKVNLDTLNLDCYWGGLSLCMGFLSWTLLLVVDLCFFSNREP